MAHLVGHAAEEVTKGPAAAIGVIAGGLGALILGLTAFAPANCALTNVQLATEGVTYACGSLQQAFANPDLISFDLLTTHTVPWLGIFGAAIAGGLVGHLLWERPWS